MFTKQVNLVIVDDHPLIIQGLEALFNSHEQLHVMASFSQGKDVLALLQEQEVDVVIMDISLPDISGLDLCREIKTVAPNKHVIALTNHNERSLILQMLQNGASGYLLKNACAEELLGGIMQVLNGQLSFSKGIQEIITQSVVNENAQVPKPTRRELEVLKLIAAGETSVVIADQLCVSPLTIEMHRRNLMQKFKARNVAELITMSFQQGLLS